MKPIWHPKVWAFGFVAHIRGCNVAKCTDCLTFYNSAELILLFLFHPKLRQTHVPRLT
ncbi:hypothetical protein MIZ03_0603 [Rhodoferax lithotrophicus]|uniref:Uncharacterized protein n=1 Tax=Rhodoferax lithotrophicus TaxID=2798804 RepID=A0ABN6D139_9BURK|nr:hypothetical protein MIZ03_0603 [Rhodoferax sp. MIZ03]